MSANRARINDLLPGRAPRTSSGIARPKSTRIRSSSGTLISDDALMPALSHIIRL